MKRFVLLVSLIALVGVAAVTLVVLRDDDPSGGTLSGKESSVPKPEPTLTTAELRSERVGGRYRVWPRSENVANDGVYRFSAPHCGLEWMTDFDGSFWRIIDKSYGKDSPSFFINGDRGTLTFEDDDSVVYRASTGEEVRLRRLPGPIVIHLCD